MGFWDPLYLILVLIFSCSELEFDDLGVFGDFGVWVVWCFGLGYCLIFTGWVCVELVFLVNFPFLGWVFLG